MFLEELEVFFLRVNHDSLLTARVTRIGLVSLNTLVYVFLDVFSIAIQDKSGPSQMSFDLQKKVVIA